MAATNIDSFVRGIRLDGKRFPKEQMGLIMRKTCLVLTDKVVHRTPVDEGRARGNWQATRGTPAGGIIERKDRSGSSVIAEANRTIGQLDPFDIYFLTNNLPYIERLAAGWSDQAPDGVMVDLSIQETMEMFL